MRMIGNGIFARRGYASLTLSCAAGLCIISLLSVLISFKGQAKKPGERHCYRDICVDVLTISEVKKLLGKTVKLNTSHYDDPSVDPFNRGTFTSNGERFTANDPTRTASANFPDGTELLLRNPKNGRVSHVRVNDFGPFWVNRDLDVTRRVAEDLGFAKQGIIELEATVVAPPREEDIRALYRRDRQPVPTLGHLGVRSVEETAKLAKILLQRLPAEQQKTIFAKDRLKAENVPTMVKRETIVHYVPKQSASPRASGAEAFTDAQQQQAKQALDKWWANLLERRQQQLNVFAWLSVLLMAALAGPLAAPLYLNFYRYTLTILGWNFNTQTEVAPESTIAKNIINNQRKSMIMHREMMQRNNVTFEETYFWPELPMRYGSSCPPADRSGLNFDIDYTWPNITNDRTTSNGYEDVEENIELLSSAPANGIQSDLEYSINDDEKDKLTQLPAHERLRLKLDGIKDIFDPTTKRTK